MKTAQQHVYVEPKSGRTVRFPAGHDREGDRIPAASETPDRRGTKVPLSSYYVRALQMGDLKEAKAVRGGTSTRPSKAKATASAEWPETFSGMLKSELVDLAKAHDVPTSDDQGALTKDELLDALTAAKEG